MKTSTSRQEAVYWEVVWTTALLLLELEEALMRALMRAFMVAKESKNKKYYTENIVAISMYLYLIVVLQGDYNNV